jgi:site-specific recombinase XerC
MDQAPFDGVKLPKENAPRHQVWTWQLIKRVLRASRVGKTAEMQRAFHVALRTGMRLAEVLAAPANFDAQRQVVTIKTKTEARAQIPIGRIATKLIASSTFSVQPNEGSVLFSKLCRELLIGGLTFHDTRFDPCQDQPTQRPKPFIECLLPGHGRADCWQDLA